MALSSYMMNKIVDWYRGQAFPTVPANIYVGLLTSTKGPRSGLNSANVALNDTVSLTANDGKTHLYKVTTAGALTASQGTLYPGAIGEAITDGTAVLTEQTAALANGGGVEVSGGAYARQAVAGSLTAWAGTQGAGTTVASSGTTSPESTSNNGAITFPSATALWGFVWGVGLWDASTAGNLLDFGGLTNVQTVNTGGQLSFAAAQLTLTFQ